MAKSICKTGKFAQLTRKCMPNAILKLRLQSAGSSARFFFGAHGLPSRTLSDNLKCKLCFLRARPESTKKFVSNLIITGVFLVLHIVSSRKPRLTPGNLRQKFPSGKFPKYYFIIIVRGQHLQKGIRRLGYDGRSL